MQNYEWKNMKPILDNVRQRTEAEFISSDSEFIKLENELEITEDAALEAIAALSETDKAVLNNYITILHRMIFERSLLNYAAGLKDHNEIIEKLVSI